MSDGAGILLLFTTYQVCVVENQAVWANNNLDHQGNLWENYLAQNLCNGGAWNLLSKVAAFQGRDSFYIWTNFSITLALKAS